MVSPSEFTSRFAAEHGDSEDLRTEKATIFLVASACCVAGLVWAGTYWAVFGWGLTTALPLAFTVIVGASMVGSHVRRDHRLVVTVQLAAIILITSCIQWSIGGLADSGFVFVWALLGPIGALMFFSPRQSLPWLGLFLVCLVVTVTLDASFAASQLTISDSIRRLFTFMNLGVSSLVIFMFAGYFVSTAVDERRRADRLLLNVLPEQIAVELKRTGGTIAHRHEMASVLFADIVGSTPLFADLDSTEVVDWLNEVFVTLDEVVERHGLEKLRTMGDNYMVAAGVPTPRTDHATALVGCALEMIDVLALVPQRNGHRIAFRYGINSGPLVAGVVGKSKFHYDLWGDTVNVASRMESTGEVDRIHISSTTYELIRDDFDCVERGPIAVKGKGQMTTWFVTRPRPARNGSRDPIANND